MKKIVKNRNGDKLHMVLFFYWLTLLLWQNIRTATNRSTEDIFVKIALLLLIILVVMHVSSRERYSMKGIPLLISFFGTQFITMLVNDEPLGFSLLISIAFPVSFAYMFLIDLRNKGINAESLKEFLKSYVSVMLLLCAWSVIFDWRKFSGAVNISSAYGNELSSFLRSSHEYGMYLAFAILSCMFLIHMTGNDGKHKRLYYLAIFIFSVNLVLTYSRTCYLALAIGIVCMTYTCNKKVFYRIIALVMVALFLVAFVPSLNNFFFNTILKKNDLAGRDVLLQSGIDAFKAANIEQKLFGYGYTMVKSLARHATGNSSFHNAYMEVLLTGGVFMLLFLVVVLIYALKNAICCYSIDKYWGSSFLGMVLMSISFMTTNTPILCTSQIDSFCLTLFTVVFPRFIFNALRSGDFTVAPANRLGTTVIRLGKMEY